MRSDELEPPNVGQDSNLVPRRTQILLNLLLVEISLVLQTLDVGEHFIEGLDDHSGDAAGVVQLPQQLEVFEVFRGLELAPEPRLSPRSRAIRRSMWWPINQSVLSVTAPRTASAPASA